jgi:ankyrin repeat protein
MLQEKFFKALRADDLPLVENLIAQGADIHAKNSEGIHPLFTAVACSEIAIVKKLLLAGADADQKNVRGDTALMFACQICSAEKVALLLEYSRDRHATNNGYSALDIAKIYKRTNIEKLFVKAEMAPETCQKEPKSP